MKNEEQDRALQTPAEANRDKHMNYVAAEDEGLNNEKQKENEYEKQMKHDADSGNDTTNEMLQHEELIDPGNEHNHHNSENKDEVTNSRSQHDADAGGDGTGTFGSKPE